MDRCKIKVDQICKTIPHHLQLSNVKIHKTTSTSPVVIFQTLDFGMEYIMKISLNG